MNKTATIDGIEYDLVPKEVKEVKKVMGSVYRISDSYGGGIYILCRTTASDWRLMSTTGYRWSDQELEYDIKHHGAVKIADSLAEYLKENTL